jgi:methyl-accepting chemotaxis protein
MNAQLQAWMPAIIALLGSLIVAVFTAWLNTRALSSQIEALRAEMRQGLAELRLDFLKDWSDVRLEISELSHRVERLEEQRGLVRP